jgi:hypothetical protein
MDEWDANNNFINETMTMFNESMGIEQKKNTETDTESI